MTNVQRTMELTESRPENWPARPTIQPEPPLHCRSKNLDQNHRQHKLNYRSLARLPTLRYMSFQLDHRRRPPMTWPTHAPVSFTHRKSNTIIPDIHRANFTRTPQPMFTYLVAKMMEILKSGGQNGPIHQSDQSSKPWQSWKDNRRQKPDAYGQTSKQWPGWIDYDEPRSPPKPCEPPKPETDYLRQEIFQINASDLTFTPEQREEYPEVDYEELVSKTASLHTRAKHVAPYVKAYNNLPSDADSIK